MNESSPRRYRGSLIERAAEFQFRAPPQAEPAPAEPLIDPVPAPVETPPVVVRSEPASSPLFDVAEPQEPLIRQTPPIPVEKPVPAIAQARETGRSVLPVDRTMLAARGMIVPAGPVTPIAEEFRLVKRHLLTTARGIADARRARMILICSAQANEGKTFCAINLALSLAAEQDVEILLVDADFAKPDVLASLGLPAGPGLLDVLAGSVAHAEDCIIDTDVPQLSVLPAGAQTNMDTELLAGERAREILDGLATANPRRIVIFDSPPALAASPAAVLAEHVGQVMLVVRADRTSESDLREATAMLDGCEHIQLLLNSVSFLPGGRRYGNYYGYGEAAK